MITKFGIWQIDENVGLLGKVNPTHDYKIAKETLWETTEYKGQIVWDWLIHLTEKTWIDTESLNDLIVAFLFAQDYFKSFKPSNARNASNAQTIYLAQKLIELRKDTDDEDDEMGIDILSEESINKMAEYLNKESNIKPLIMK